MRTQDMDAAQRLAHRRTNLPTHDRRPRVAHHFLCTMDGPASSYSDLLIHCAAQQHIRIRFLLCHVTQRIDWMRHGRMQDKARAVTV